MTNAEALRQAFIDDLIRKGGIQFGEFTLAGGGYSPVKVEMDVLHETPNMAALLFWELIADLPQCDRLVPVPSGATPFVEALAGMIGMPMLTASKPENRYEPIQIEGDYEPGQTAIVFEDVVTTGGSIVRVLEALQERGIIVSHAVALVDREQGAWKLLDHKRCRLHAVTTLKKLLSWLSCSGAISQGKYSALWEMLWGDS